MRQYLQRIRTLVVLMALVAAALLGYIFYQRSHTRDIDAQIGEAQQESAS